MTWGVTAIWTAVASTAVQAYGSNKARKERKKAAAIDRKRRDLDSRRALIGNIDEYRVASAGVVNAGAQQSGGANSSSGFQGAQASLTSQVGSNITYENQIMSFAESSERYLQKANLAEWQGQMWGAGLNTASSFATYKKTA